MEKEHVEHGSTGNCSASVECSVAESEPWLKDRDHTGETTLGGLGDFLGPSDDWELRSKVISPGKSRSSAGQCYIGSDNLSTVVVHTEKLHYDPQPFCDATGNCRHPWGWEYDDTWATRGNTVVTDDVHLHTLAILTMSCRDVHCNFSREVGFGRFVYLWLKLMTGLLVYLIYNFLHFVYMKAS